MRFILGDFWLLGPLCRFSAAALQQLLQCAAHATEAAQASRNVARKATVRAKEREYVDVGVWSVARGRGWDG